MSLLEIASVVRFSSTLLIVPFLTFHFLANGWVLVSSNNVIEGIKTLDNTADVHSLTIKSLF